MTKEEAIKAMREGKKVTHQYFIKNEWMTMEGNRIIFEDDCSCWAHEFWADRKYVGWEDGYSLY
jgi:hypothetical protein